MAGVRQPCAPGILRILGKPSESLCTAFEKRGIAVTKLEEADQGSLLDQVSEIGADDEPPMEGEAFTRAWLEPPGIRPTVEEVCCLTGLLQRTLHYTPDERLPIKEILKHTWVNEDF